MTTNAIPSRNQANDDQLAGLFSEVLNKFLSNIDDMLPAIVEQYDADKNRATVKILIQKISTDNSLTSRSSIASVPVFQMGAGGFMINVKPVAGDIGWLKASDRDISLFLQSYGESKPNTFRKHDFSDSVFFPDIMRSYSVTSDEGLVIQKNDGTQRIALLDNSVRITATSVIIDSATVETTGDLTIGGSVLSSGEVTANANTPASVSLSSHTHTGNQGNPTSPPTPGT